MARSADAKKTRNKNAPFPWLWPVLIITVGVLLLLDNFLLLGDFNAVVLLPLLLVVAGTQILLRGDLLPSGDSSAFGITRGSVESGTLEISAGGVDVALYPLRAEGRLIAGQYAAGSRPHLDVHDTYSHIQMNRADTAWYAMSDWSVGLAKDLPWQFLVSTHLGQIDADLSELVVHEAILSSGIGDIRLVLPRESFKTLFIRSAFGNVHIVTPPGCRARVRVEGSRVFRARHDEYRYTPVEPNLFESTEYEADAPTVNVVIRGTFGDAYLV
ncbi:MAG: hypothetical protein EA396_07055 [Anaerolineaceae bacterium]|nr:MAG: hypothetical protein EA396_07055 [Anaerolineaceae bacterium]